MLMAYDATTPRWSVITKNAPSHILLKHDIHLLTMWSWQQPVMMVNLVSCVEGALPKFVVQRARDAINHVRISRITTPL